MKKKKLDAEINYDFILLGLISPLKEYKLAWSINQSLKIQLSKQSDIELEFIKAKNLLISNYTYETEHSLLRLLKNKSINEFVDKPSFLVPELKRFDFLIQAFGFEDTFSAQDLKNKVSDVPKVQFVQNFVIDELKSRENLIF